MDYESKSRLMILLQLAGLLFFVLTVITFFVPLFPSSSSPGFSTISLAITGGMFLITFLIILGNFVLFYGFFTMEERARFMMRRSGKNNAGGLSTKAPKFVMLPDESIVIAPTTCFYHMGFLLGFSESTGDVTVTNKRIHLKLPAGESSFWRIEVKEIPKRSLIQIGYSINDYTIQKVSYEEENEGGKTSGFLKLGLGEEDVVFEAKIYHPRAKEISDMFSAPFRG